MDQIVTLNVAIQESIPTMCSCMCAKQQSILCELLSNKISSHVDCRSLYLSVCLSICQSVCLPSKLLFLSLFKITSERVKFKAREFINKTRLSIPTKEPNKQNKTARVMT